MVAVRVPSDVAPPEKSPEARDSVADVWSAGIVTVRDSLLAGRKSWSCVNTSFTSSASAVAAARVTVSSSPCRWKASVDTSAATETVGLESVTSSV